MSTIHAENATVEREADVATGSIHLSLQGKGGVGKSLTASILAQYFRQRGHDVQCIDTDPVNQTCGGTPRTTWPNYMIGEGRIDVFAAYEVAIGSEAAP